MDDIEIGQNCRVIIEVWDEDKTPCVTNSYEGKITEVVEKTKDVIYVKLENLDRLIPINRVIA